MIYILYIRNMASWLINWPGALGFYLQPITLLHYDNFTLEFVVLSSRHNSRSYYNIISICQHARLLLLIIIAIYTSIVLT